MSHGHSDMARVWQAHHICVMFMGASTDTGLCFVYVNVWPGSKLMQVSILLHLGLVMQSRVCRGEATLDLNNEHCNWLLHENSTTLYVTDANLAIAALIWDEKKFKFKIWNKNENLGALK